MGVGARQSVGVVAIAATLRAHGDRVAIVHGSRHLTYLDLDARVETVAQQLRPSHLDHEGGGGPKRLVVVAAGNDVASIVAYLAALRAGHAVALTAPGQPDHLRALVDRYDPDVVLHGGGDEPSIEEHRPGTRHDLHPDLALLLSTSGTTGSPKLVRLSHTNVQSNAESIAGYLRIGPADLAATTLPMHYCYGLSVVNSHLAQGAGLLLTDLSVVDRCFWDAFRAEAATSFAGVPYTFELLERAGFADLSLPSLRYVTQAGGRLDPELVKRYATLGRRDGWQLVVMYGQTEATARMAYLPPHEVLRRPSAIGVPIPGGSFRLEPLEASEHLEGRQQLDPCEPLTTWRPGTSHDASAVAAPSAGEPDVGELVYRGANVMMGYAETPAELGRGAELDELRTGDVARRHADGLYEIVGRRSRFVKLFGLRVELDQVERGLARLGFTALCTGSDELLAIAVAHLRGASVGEPVSVLARAVELSGLPPSAIEVVEVDQLPRLPSGKPDYAAVLVVAERAQQASRVGRVDADDRVGAASGQGLDRRGALVGLYADVLHRDDVDETATFVSLGGDSLSYIEMSIRLERSIGSLPSDWPVRSIADLAEVASTGHRRRHPRRHGLARIETNVALRAIAIVLIVGNHIGLFHLTGGAHVLLGIAGFNFGRFTLASGRVWRTIARIAVPSMCWIAVVAVAYEKFGVSNVLLMQTVLGPHTASRAYWFIEALVHILVVLALLRGIPAVRRFEARLPVATATLVLMVGLLVRFDLMPIPESRFHISHAHQVLWLFAVGWLAARAPGRGVRVACSVVLLVAVPGFFGDQHRDWMVLAGMLSLVWIPRLAIPSPVARLAGLLARTSLYIYLVHWQIFPEVLERSSPLVAWVTTLAAGVAIGWVALGLVDWVSAQVRLGAPVRAMEGSVTDSGEDLHGEHRNAAAWLDGARLRARRRRREVVLTGRRPG